jgi:rubrerythrin
VEKGRRVRMGISFNANEIFEMAEQIERNGSSFYRRVAKSFKDANSCQKLLDLAAMEDEHERIFHAMRADLSGQEGVVSGFDPSGEAALYLQAIADSEVFDVRKDPTERLTGKESLEEILLMAIGIEKDSIIFYQGIKEMVPERLGKDRVEAIIKEEMGHIITLSKELASLKELNSPGR